MMLEWDKSGMTSGLALDNKLGITTEEELSQPERRLSSARLFELQAKELNQNIVFDKGYFLKIHKYLFQDIYPWAGTVREVDLYKGNSAFAPARFLDAGLDEFFNNLAKDNFLKGFTIQEVAELSSYYMLELNFLHPFREGNGRTKRYFMTKLTQQAGYDLGLEKINADQLVMADILAFDDNEADIKANPSFFKSLINKSLQPLPGTVQNKATDKIDELNRFLWVYDRFDSRAWFSNKKSLENSKSKLEELLSTEQGKEKISVHLDKIIINEKKYNDGTALYREEIIKTAYLFKNQLSNIKTKSRQEEVVENKPSNKPLDEKLDEFYGKFDPYGRYDGVGSFLSQYDYNKEGLTQIREALKSDMGRKGIDDFLKECIKTDGRPEIIKEAKQLRLELLNPVNQKGSMASYLQQIEAKQPVKKNLKKENSKQKVVKY